MLSSRSAQLARSYIDSEFDGCQSSILTPLLPLSPLCPFSVFSRRQNARRSQDGSGGKHPLAFSFAFQKSMGDIADALSILYIQSMVPPEASLVRERAVT